MGTLSVVILAVTSFTLPMLSDFLVLGYLVAAFLSLKDFWPKFIPLTTNFIAVTLH